ncbi:hypothetical protein QJS04_geneDACA017714 [Acorus gramineus]|uniref:Transmembrane protein n=1 Tax=Acorus gramineus TaxID=55184 RepID=A0AAV9BTA8_ACOGR|nr:hypothetical protein QJS04_geneDACA017714 [Acorus gramineus]
MIVSSNPALLVFLFLFFLASSAIQKPTKPSQQHLRRTHSPTPPTKTSSASTTSTAAVESSPQTHPLNPLTGNGNGSLNGDVDGGSVSWWQCERRVGDVNDNVNDGIVKLCRGWLQECQLIEL